jgi:hypothetical protein
MGKHHHRRLLVWFLGFIRVHPGTPYARTDTSVSGAYAGTYAGTYSPC